MMIDLSIYPQVFGLVWSKRVPRYWRIFWRWIPSSVFFLLTKSDFSHSIFSMPGKVGPHLDKGGGHQAVLGVEWVVLRPERVPQEVQLIAICGENWLFNNTLEITKIFDIKNRPNLMTLLISLYSS